MKERSFGKQLCIDAGLIVVTWIVLFLIWYLAPEDTIPSLYRAPLLIMLFVGPVVLLAQIAQAYWRKKKSDK